MLCQRFATWELYDIYLSTFWRNPRNKFDVADYTASYAKRELSSYPLPPEPQIWRDRLSEWSAIGIFAGAKQNACGGVTWRINCDIRPGKRRQVAQTPAEHAVQPTSRHSMQLIPQTNTHTHTHTHTKDLCSKNLSSVKPAQCLPSLDLLFSNFEICSFCLWKIRAFCSWGTLRLPGYLAIFSRVFK